MSRIAKQPIALDSKVKFEVKDNVVTVKGPKGELSMNLHESVTVEQNDGELNVSASDEMIYMAGTMRSLINNMVEGVTNGFNKKLQLVGVGYRVAMKGKDLDLNLGFSHPVIYPAREGITFETPTQTEIVVNGVDKQVVGQVAAEIRAIRPPEPYKGKGVKYADERLYRKEAKKA
ncbi:50S ribosomal protein L6 [Marinicella sp. S1101]|uniref:50S ribosomal protein L6 n=1 Tax=Marinicella marina TaxID=2996016 RepID=UPI002260B877|nr:50S ribosomal protein L6 [Marinicella marina]MCX7555103.1 50S ribosomal protein L6 [Marinicella marina]MDJ1140312.1 50S ribosomal protein L6 [Marinicella marina]